MLEHFFQPRSIAVIGAAREEYKLGHSILKNILDYNFPGKVYPINPRADSILGLHAYPSVKMVEDSVELAVLVLPAELCLQAIEECGQKGIDSAVIISGGFKEIGGEGVEREKELSRLAKKYNIRVVGPNCLGIINTHYRLNATFAANPPPKGHVAFFSQSGAICSAILDWAQTQHLGFSKFVSMGNNMDINEVDLLKAFEDDPECRVILGYIEGIKDGRAFMEEASRVTRKKPVVIIKSGSTGAGARAVSSHTGSLAGSDNAFRAAFKQSGILRVETLEDLFSVAQALSAQETPPGPQVAIFSNAGGPAILTADAVERSDLRMASFYRETVEALRNCLPRIASFYNPVDITGGVKEDVYRVAMEKVLQDENVHAVVAINAPQAVVKAEEVARVVGELSKKFRSKTVIASFMGGPTMKEAVELLAQYQVPNYPFPETAVAVLEAMFHHRQWRERPMEKPNNFRGDKRAVEEVFRKARLEGRLNLAEAEARQVIAAYGFSIPRSILVTDKALAVKAALEVGFPLVLKVASPDILHKSDVGGVKVGISSLEEAGRAFEEMMERVRKRMPVAHIHGAFVQEMIKGGREVILGAVKDPQFGPLLMFGLGGIYVEVLRDVSFRIAPITSTEARKMIEETKAYSVLKGTRGERPADLEAVVEGLQKLSQLVIDFPDILELDINPLAVLPEGAVAIDARITLSA
ncbi:MAG TPA: acetate--CoA ligase alpha subunit [Candidatus Hypogeohydataceae bacterium YC41]